MATRGSVPQGMAAASHPALRCGEIAKTIYPSLDSGFGNLQTFPGLLLAFLAHWTPVINRSPFLASHSPVATMTIDSRLSWERSDPLSDPIVLLFQVSGAPAIFARKRSPDFHTRIEGLSPSAVTLHHSKDFLRLWRRYWTRSRREPPKLLKT